LTAPSHISWIPLGTGVLYHHDDVEEQECSRSGEKDTTRRTGKRTKSLARETSFPRLERWEDGRRMPGAYQLETFDWWYADARLTHGRTDRWATYSARARRSTASLPPYAAR
jgi:hypothetical protein